MSDEKVSVVSAPGETVSIKLIVIGPNGQQQEIIIPLQQSLTNMELQRPRVKRTRSGSTPFGSTSSNRKRARTKDLLTTKFTRNSSLPMWLAELGCSFDPEDADFFETKLKPVLEKKCKARKLERLASLSKKVDSLKWFLVTNYPDLVHSNVLDLVSDRERFPSLSPKEESTLSTIGSYTKRPEELFKFHRQAQRQVKKDKADRVLVAFANMTIFKPSFTNIDVSES